MKKLMFCMALCVVLISMVSAEISFYVPQTQGYDLKVGCEFNGAICDNSYSCNLSIDYPNSTVLIDNQAMTNQNNGLFNYTLTSNQTITKGEYSSLSFCENGTFDGNEDFTYEVNPPGIRPSLSRTDAVSRGVYFLFAIAILLFIAFLFAKQKLPVKWTFFLISIMLFLAALNILFVGLEDEIVNPRIEGFFSFFTTASFYLFWFAFGLLAIMWILTLLQTIFFKKNLDQMRRFGSG